MEWWKGWLPTGSGAFPLRSAWERVGEVWSSSLCFPLVQFCVLFLFFVSLMFVCVLVVFTVIKFRLISVKNEEKQVQNMYIWW